MRATCHRSNVQRHYCSGVLSLSHIAVIVLWVIAAFLPLLLAYGSRDFVLEVNSYREQPVVKFSDQVIYVLEGECDHGRGKQPLTLVHSTFPEQTQQLNSNESLRPTVIETSSRDGNADGVPDSVHVEIGMPLSTNETIRQVTVVIVLDYTLKSYVKVKMDVIAVLRHSSPFAGDELHADGDLELHQRSTFEVTDSMQHPFIDSPITNMTNTTQELLISSLISRYRERNYTVNFHSPYPIWTSNPNASKDIRVFRTVMDIRINAANILYTPKWPEIVKHAWIQYYCIFVAVTTFAIALREYLFVSKLLSSVCVEPQKIAKYE